MLLYLRIILKALFSKSCDQNCPYLDQIIAACTYVFPPKYYSATTQAIYRPPPLVTFFVFQGFQEMFIIRIMNSPDLSKAVTDIPISDNRQSLRRII